MARILDELREAVPLARALKGLVGDTEAAMGKLATAAAAVIPPQGVVPSVADAGSPGAVSTGTGGGGGSRTGPRMLRSQRGKYSKPEDWVKSHCTQTTVKLGKDEVLAWDCSLPLGDPEAIFLDQDAMQELMQRLRPSASARGTRTGKNPGAPNTRTEYAGTAYDASKPLTGSTGTTTPSLYPSTAPSTASQDETNRLLREIRDQGRQDGSLARRTGGRP